MKRGYKSGYVALQCMECGAINVFPNETADGTVCFKCNGYTKPIGEAYIKDNNNKRNNGITVDISVDTTQLDEALEKVKLMNNLLSNSNQLIKNKG